MLLSLFLFLRFLSRETLESDGYDKIDEFDEPDPHRNKVGLTDKKIDK